MTVSVAANIVWADRAPTAYDDHERAAYSRGMLWVNTSASKMYLCTDDTHDAAVWVEFTGIAIEHADFTGSTAGTMVRTGAGTYAVLRNNSAASAPGVTNDVSEGYGVFSQWLDTTGPDLYVCTDATDGAAVWVATYAAP